MVNFYVNQSIVIHSLKVGGLSNSSVFQIGSAGLIKPLSNLYNTGGFTAPAPAAKPIDSISLIPLQPPELVR